MSDIGPIRFDGDHPDMFGKNKGIQGHYNSCYLDSTLMSMFAFNSSFDYLLRKKYQEHQVIGFLRGVIDPLRRKGFTSVEKVTDLREALDNAGHDRGLTEEEKDPEEFLNLLLEKIMREKPFLELNSGESSFIYQIFVEKNENLEFPTVQHLLEESFISNDIKLKHVPDNLLLIMPRFGKAYKVYNHIFPPILLDVGGIVENGIRRCLSCGQSPVTVECRDCFKNVIHMQHRLYAVCDDCSKLIHKHPNRGNHNVKQLPVKSSLPNKDLDVQMELFAIICIETSHYVSFIKCGTGLDAKWCFFDSMADREGDDVDGINISEVTSLDDEHLEYWLSDHGYEDENNEQPRLVRRLFKDVYMCMYRPYNYKPSN